MAATAKEAAARLALAAKEKKVRFPKVFDEQKIMQQCGATLMLFRGGTNFDEAAALEKLIETYGCEQSEEKPSSPSKKKKRSESEEEAGAEEGSPKKVKKTAVVQNEKNRGIAEFVKEMADIYFQNKDPRKGGVFSKAAKAIREWPEAITNKKEAMALPGVGKGIAGYIEEFLDTGMVTKLEELRAGTA